MPRTELPVLLLVDDGGMVSDSLAFVLREAARALTVKLDTIPSLALVDLGLPPVTHLPDEGFALISDLLPFNPRMKILVLSGQRERTNVQHALTLGTVDFIPKPCEVELLKTRLEHQLMIFEAESADASSPSADHSLLGESRSIKELREEIERDADTPR